MYYMGVHIHHWEVGILRGDRRRIVKYRDTLVVICVKMAAPISMPFGFALGLTQGIMCYMGFQIPMARGNFEGGKGGPL